MITSELTFTFGASIAESGIFMGEGVKMLRIEKDVADIASHIVLLTIRHTIKTA
jgi:hypothetical protein